LAKQLPRFERNYGVHSQMFRIHEDEGEIFIRNARNQLPNEAASHPRKRKTKNVLVWHDKENFVAKKAFCLHMVTRMTEHPVVSTFCGAKW